MTAGDRLVSWRSDDVDLQVLAESEGWRPGWFRGVVLSDGSTLIAGKRDENESAPNIRWRHIAAP
jgi:hypothetical protein